MDQAVRRGAADWVTIGYDPEVRPPSHILRAIQSYDRQLFLLFNRLVKKWELWRWRTMVVPAWRVGIREFTRRAVFVMSIEEGDGSAAPIDARLPALIFLADRHRRFISGKEEVRVKTEMKDRAEYLKDEKTHETFQEIARDNRRQLRLDGGSPIVSFPDGPEIKKA